jgi:hypothetical protein
MKRLFEVLQRAAPDSGWFWSTFLSASEGVIRRWGPTWTSWRVAGHPIGVWILAALWLAVPVAVTAAVVP